MTIAEVHQDASPQPRQFADGAQASQLRRRKSLLRLDFDGNEVWRVSPGEFHSVHGFCSPPTLYKDLVIVNVDQDAPSGKNAYIVAFDKRTGEERWRIDRPNKLRSYCPPVIVQAAGKDQMVLTGSKCVTS